MSELSALRLPRRQEVLVPSNDGESAKSMLAAPSALTYNAKSFAVTCVEPRR